MKVVLYGRRNVCLIALSHLVSIGYEAVVISDDENVLNLATRLGQKISPLIKSGNEILLDHVGKYDWFICVHGNLIIPERYIVHGKMWNIHPMLFKYPGHSPIKKVIRNKDREGSVESHYITADIDMGNVIHQEFFKIPICNTFADYYNVAIPYYFKCLDATLNKILQ